MRHAKDARRKRKKPNPRSGLRLPPIPGKRLHKNNADYSRKWDWRRELADEGYEE